MTATHVAPTLTDGFVAPAYLSVPDHHDTHGPEAAEFWAIGGKTLDPEQRAALDAHMVFRADGKWAAFEDAMIESRQHGKTSGVLLPAAAYDLFELSSGEDEFGDPDRIVWTAHRYKTAQDAFTDLVSFVESSYEISRDVRRITYSHGEQGIELMNGASLVFMAREGGGSGRGLGGKRLVFDEALILGAGVIGAALPVLSARPNPKVVYGSSGAKADDTSAHLRALVRRGRAGNDPSLCYIEYCAPGGWGTVPCAAELREEECVHGVTAGCNAPPCLEGRECTHVVGVPGCVFDREDYWQAAGHSTGRRVTVEYLRNERRTLGATAAGVLELGRERLGWHQFPETETGESVINLKGYVLLGDVTTPPPGEGTGVTIAIDVPPDASVTTVAVAWWFAGRRWVMYQRYQGTTTAPAEVKKMQDRGGVIDCAMQTNGPAGSVFNLMVAAGVDVRPVPGTEVAQGVGAWRSAIKHGQLGHLNQPELYAAQKAVKLRKVGDAVIWARDDLTDLSPLFACSIALNAMGAIAEDDTGPNVW